MRFKIKPLTYTTLSTTAILRNPQKVPLFYHQNAAKSQILLK